MSVAAAYNTLTRPAKKAVAQSPLHGRVGRAGGANERVSTMATNHTSELPRRRRLTGDVNGLALVLGALALLLVTLPCPMSAASQIGIMPAASEAAVSVTTH